MDYKSGVRDWSAEVSVKKFGLKGQREIGK